MSVYLRKYGVETKIDFALYATDGTALKTDAASATGDVTLYRDEAAVETLDADAFVDEGSIYSLTLSAAEMAAARIIVCVVDQGTKAWLDKTLIVETYGDASAQHQFDLATAIQSVNVTQIGGVAQSATDLKDFVDTGYDPATHKVQGVVLTDTCTTNTDMVTDVSSNVTSILADTNELQGLISASKLPAQVKGIDDIDLSATMKASVNAEVDTALNTAIPGSPTSDSVNERIATMDIAYSATRAGYLDLLNTNLNAPVATIDTVVDSILTETQSHPTLAEIEASTILAKEATFTHATYGLDKIKTETASVKAKTDIIGASVALETGGNLATVLTETQSHPTLAEIEATAVLAKEATLTHATYGLDKIKTETASIKAKTDNLPADPADDSDIDTQLAALSVLATAIKKVTVNKWAIVGSQLIYYDDDGTTPLYTFTLDSVTSPTSRTPV